MSITPQASSAMAAVLDEETREVQTFIKLLNQEQELLVSGDKGDALLPLVALKTNCTARLEALAARREQFLAASGKASGRPGMEAWLAESKAEAALTRWRELLDLAAQARALNDANGRLIGIHLQHNQAALNTLMSAANRAMTYGPDGQQKGAGGGRSFGKF